MSQTLQHFPLLQIRAQALKIFAQGGSHARYNTGLSCVAKILCNITHLGSFADHILRFAESKGFMNPAEYLAKDSRKKHGCSWVKVSLTSISSKHIWF